LRTTPLDGELARAVHWHLARCQRQTDAVLCVRCVAPPLVKTAPCSVLRDNTRRTTT
jgi:hypothetical protein